MVMRFDFSDRRVFKVGDKVRYKADYLARNPDLFKRFNGRIGVVTNFRAGAADPVVEFAAQGRRKSIKIFEACSPQLELAPDSTSTDA